MNKKYIKIITVIFISINVFFIPRISFAAIKYVTPKLSLTSGLVGWWTMDGNDTIWTSSTAGTVIDKSGNGNTGTLNGMSITTSPVLGKIGQAMYFDGVNDRIETSNTSSLNITGNITASTWVKFNSIGNFKRLLVNKDFDAWGLAQSSTVPGRMRFVVNLSGSGTVTAEDTAALSLNKWYLVTGVYDGSNVILYVNGQEVGRTAGTGTILSTSGVTVIGCDTVCTYRTDGSIDDSRVYNRALSAGEIYQLYNIGSSKYNITPRYSINSGLVGWWTMDGNDTLWTSSTAGTVIDKSGNGNTGTLNGMSRTTSPVLGKIGQAIYSDTSNNRIQTSNTASLTIGNNITVSTWVKLSSIATFRRLFVNGNFDAWALAQSSTVAGRMRFVVKLSSGTVTAEDTTALSLNKWYLVTGVYDGSNVILYINGQEVGRTAGTGTIVSTTGVTVIGCDSSCSANESTNGSIDDSRVYNRALSAGEVYQLYRIGR